jgi:hypothetical protein
LTLNLVPVAPLPPGVKPLAWTIKLPRRPLEGHGVTLTIYNPKVLKYYLHAARSAMR